jgi:hypothetical protein
MPMDSGIVDQMRSAIGNYLLPHRHTALLVAIVALLGVRPLMSDSGAGNAVFSAAVMLVLVVALYTIQVDELLGDRERLLRQRKKRSQPTLPGPPDGQYSYGRGVTALSIS